MDAQKPYCILDEAGVRRHLASVPELAARLAGAPGQWQVREVSDGNLNSVFLVDGADGNGCLCVKQSLPYVRVDVDWKLPLDRAFFEAAYLRATAPLVQGAAPALLHYDPDLFCLVMEQLQPHIILRRGLIEQIVYPRVAGDVGLYVARSAFGTSGFARPFEAVMDDVALFAKNQTLTRITVDLVLTDPYRESPRNRWTQPFLDEDAAVIRGDDRLKSAAMRMGQRFLCCPQALLHGDLHTGSVMVTQTDTRVIDGEFSLFGPIGFDLGLFVANLLLSLFAHACAPGTGAYRDWVVEQIGTVWAGFHGTFAALWRDRPTGGDIMPPMLFADAEASRAELDTIMNGIFNDMLGFAGMEMIRRVLGFAHVLDLERIADARRRASAERAVLGFARRLLVECGALGSADALMRAAREAALELVAPRR